ncbi:helix-turn-helix domain-containing protein [Tepidibacter mesophilus]|uniref:helix-turn-helix domain-containing protein n=1 Tax=Tepidibacter mesophilus TaxID=655607 RepID=UPI000C067FF5|nr:helix-turn-helix transcriptional regulator [Tepidibacter mesophilus]
MPVKLRLKEILEEKGVSQRELARMMDTRPATISHLCSEKSKSVYYETLDQLCKTLDVHLHDLIVMEND